MTFVRQPTRAGVRDAAAKVASVVPATPLFAAEIHGISVAFKAECLQPMGAFKLRGAWHRLTAIEPSLRAKGVVAFSSGNHAQGVAWAAKKLGMPAVVVMPADAPRSKRDGTLALGAEIASYDRRTESREQIAAQLAEARGAVLVPSFDDPWVIEGQGSAGIEAAAQMQAQGMGPVVHAVVPCGGGGLAAGIALGLADTMGTEVGPNPPATACDSLQTMRVSPLTFDVLARRCVRGVAVSEAEIRTAQRWAAERLRLVVEPGGAVALAALLAGKVAATVGTLVLLSGGNVDRAAYGRVLTGED